MAFRDFRENSILTAEQMDDDVVAHLVHPVRDIAERAANFATSARRPRGKLVVNLNVTQMTVPGRPGIGGGTVDVYGTPQLQMWNGTNWMDVGGGGGCLLYTSPSPRD